MKRAGLEFRPVAALPEDPRALALEEQDRVSGTGAASTFAGNSKAGRLHRHQQEHRAVGARSLRLHLGPSMDGRRPQSWATKDLKPKQKTDLRQTIFLGGKESAFSRMKRPWAGRNRSRGEMGSLKTARISFEIRCWARLSIRWPCIKLVASVRLSHPRAVPLSSQHEPPLLHVGMDNT